MKKIMTTVTDYAIIVAGAFVYAVSVVIFTAPNNIAPGGLTGIGTVLNYLYDFPIGVIIFVFNIPLFVWGAIEHGIKFLTKTIVGTAILSVAIDVMGLFLPAYTGDLMLASIFGGILNGLGLGLIFYSGGSTGGTDIVSLNIHKHYPHLSTGTLILAFDAVIIIVAAIIYRSMESALYAVIAIFVSIKVIDAITYGFSRDNGKAMFIVTNKYKEITDKLFTSVKRGVTFLEAQGGYKMDDKKVIMCALRPQQVHKVIKIIKSVDENAFTIVTTAGSIRGNGFGKKK